MLDFEAVLVTPRLYLEPLTREHAARLFSGVQDPLLYRYYAGAPPQSLDDLVRQYAAWETRKSPDGSETWLNYAVRTKEGAYVGWVQATIRGDAATIGYDIFSPFWSRGYGSESCAELVRLLRTVQSIKSIKAVVDTENLPSIRLLEKLGFTHTYTGPSEDLPGRRDFHYEMPCQQQRNHSS